MRLLPIALCVVATFLPALAVAEARPADRLAPTLGYTSLVRAEGSPIALVEGRVDVWLQGDHATVRTRYRTGRLDPWYSLFAVTAGLGAPSENGPWPGAPRPGAFPVLLVNGRDLAPGERTVFLAGPNPVTLAPFGFEKSPLGLVHRWRAGHASSSYEVLWTVPYAGDTYGGVAPLDCSCGDPWTFAIEHTYLVVDPSGLGFAPGGPAVELRVRNASGGPVELRSLDGARTLAKLASGATWTSRLDATGGAEPWMAVFLEGWLPGAGDHREVAEGVQEPWRSRLAVACRVPTVDDGEDMPRADPKRAYDLVCAGRAGDREIAETVSIPGFLRRAIPTAAEDEAIGGGDGSPGRHWFAASLYRQLLAGPAPKVGQWPALDSTSAARRLAPEQYQVRASASIPGDRNGVDRLGDGDPDTAWCAPAPAHGRSLTVTFPTPTAFPRIAILPGFVRAPWLYEANAMPAAVRTTCEVAAAGRRTGTRSAVVALPVLAVPDLYREGVLLPIAATCPQDKVTRMTLEIAAVDGGTYSSDVCVSELVVLVGDGR